MNAIESLIFYIVSFILAIFFIWQIEKIYKKEEKQKNDKAKIAFYTIIGLGILIIISALRYQVGTDYNNYLDYYIVYSVLDFKDIISYANELLFILVIKIAYVFQEPQIMFAIIAFLTIYITYRAILTQKEKLSITLAFALYVFLYYMYSLNIIRQALAIAIILYSYKYILQRDFRKFLLMVIIATLFHTTALLFLPFYFLCPSKNEKGKKLKNLIRFLTIGAIFLIITQLDVVIDLLSQIGLFSRFSLYNVMNAQGDNKQVIINTILLLVFILYSKPLIKYNEDNRMYLFLYIVGYVLTLAGFLSPYAKRMAMYFNISEIYLLSAIPRIAKTNEQKLFIGFMIIVYMLVMFVLSAYYLNLGDIIPYQTIFNKGGV